MIVPVWHGVTAAQVVEHAPELAGILGLQTGGGWEEIVTEVVGSSRREPQPIATPGIDARVSGRDGARPALESVTPLPPQVQQALKEEVDAACQASHDRITTAATGGLVRNGSWLPDALDDLAIAEHRSTSRDVCERVCRVLIRYVGRIPSEARTEVRRTIGWRFISRYAVVFKHAVYPNGQDHRSLWTKLRLNKQTREVVTGS